MTKKLPHVPVEECPWCGIAIFDKSHLAKMPCLGEDETHLGVHLSQLLVFVYTNKEVENHDILVKRFWAGLFSDLCDVKIIEEGRRRVLHKLQHLNEQDKDRVQQYLDRHFLNPISLSLTPPRRVKPLKVSSLQKLDPYRAQWTEWFRHVKIKRVVFGSPYIMDHMKETDFYSLICKHWRDNPTLIKQSLTSLTYPPASDMQFWRDCRLASRVEYAPGIGQLNYDGLLDTLSALLKVPGNQNIIYLPGELQAQVWKKNTKVWEAFEGITPGGESAIHNAPSDQIWIWDQKSWKLVPPSKHAAILQKFVDCIHQQLADRLHIHQINQSWFKSHFQPKKLMGLLTEQSWIDRLI